MTHDDDDALKGAATTPDDATFVSPPPMTIPEAAQTGGADAPVPTSSTAVQESAPPPGLTDQTNFLPTRQVVTVFLGMTVAVMCSFLDQTIIATALPRISSELHSGKESAWVATAYLLTSMACTPLYGRWSDVFGRKQVLIFALVLFWIFSLACALARTMLQLIVFRAFQGIGGGAILTMVLIIISDIVSLKDRGKYQGIIEATITIANGVGPILGGVFSEYTTWRWAFWINLPLGGIAIAVSLWLLPLKPVHGNMREKLLRIDYVGSAITILGAVLLLLGLNWGGVTYPWTSAAVLAPLILGVAAFVVFFVWEAKFAKLPIIPVRIFKYRTVVGVYICTFMNGMTYFTIMYYIPQLIQVVRGESAITASLLLLPFIAPIAFCVFVAGQLVARTGSYKYLIVGGFTFWTIAQGLQTTFDQYSSTGKIAGILLMGGLSAGFTFQTSLLAAQAAVSRQDMAVVTGVRNFVRLFGSTLALAIAGAIANNALRNAMSPLGLAPDVQQAILDDPTKLNGAALAGVLTAGQRATLVAGYARGFQHVFYMTLACQIIATLSATFLIGVHSLSRADDRALKEEGRARVLAAKAGKRAATGAGPADAGEVEAGALEKETPSPAGASARPSEEMKGSPRDEKA